MNEQSAKSIFLEAIEQESPDHWPAFLDEACGVDARLRAEVENLLEGHRQLGTFHEPPSSDSCGQSNEVTEAEGATIGRYKLLEQIGEGGMGIVYMAAQLSPIKRKVAFKIIKPGLDTKQVVARFEAERQALGLMDHPNIARVLDGGATPSGRPYFVMELVRGIPITEFCDKHKLDNRVRLKLFTDVCQAIQHAHHKGIIHRDIKPGNALVTLHDGVPAVKVIDFGIAKALNQELTERTLFTKFSQMIGTPLYMSPEQAEMSGLDIDTRSDIYSLGVLLYELLTGTTPLDAEQLRDAAYAELQRLITDEESPKPSTRLSTLGNGDVEIASMRDTDVRGLRQFVRGDLDWIVMKALDKDRNRRYGSASGFAEDIERFLSGDAIEARPPSNTYKLRKFVGRNRGLVIAACLILTTFLFGLAGTSVGLFSARREAAAARKSEEKANQERHDAIIARRDAVEARTEAERIAEDRRRLQFASNMQLADQLWKNGSESPLEFQQLLAAWIPTDGKPDLRDFVWRYQWTRLHFSAEQTELDTTTAAISPSGNLIVADHYGIRDWDESAKAFVDRWQGDADARYQQFALSPCGRWAAKLNGRKMRLIEVATGKTLREVPGFHGRFSLGGDYFLAWSVERETTKTKDFELWDMTTGGSRKLENVEYELGRRLGVGSIAADGKSLLISTGAFRVAAHLANSAEVHHWHFKEAITCTAWAPNGSMLATGHFGGNVNIRFVESPEEVFTVETGRNSVSAIAFSSDSQQLAVGSGEGTVDFFDVAQLSEARKVATNVAAYSEPDANEVQALDRNSVDTFDTPRLLTTLNAHIGRVDRIVFSADGLRMVTHDANGAAKLWNLNERSAASPTNEPLELFASGRIGVELEDTSDGIRVTSFDPKPSESISGDIRLRDRVVAVTADESGRRELGDKTNSLDVWRMCIGRPGTTVRLHVISDDESEERTVELIRTSQPQYYTAMKFVGDLDRIIVTTSNGAFRRTANGNATSYYPVIARSVAESPDKSLIAFDDANELVLWDAKADELRLRIDGGHNGGTLSFSPDGRFLALASGNRMNVDPGTSETFELKVWDIATHIEIRSPLFENQKCISGVVFAPNSEQLLATDHDGTIRIWDTSTWELVDTRDGLARSNSIDVSSDGKFIAQGGYDGIAIWNHESGKKRHVARGQVVTALTFSPDGRSLIVTRMDGKAAMIDVETGMQLALFDTNGGMLSDCEFSHDGKTLGILSAAGNVWLLDAYGIEQIDQHPITQSVLYERGMAQGQDEQIDGAVQSLRHCLRLQEEARPVREDALRATRRELSKAMKSQGSFPEITPSVSRVKLGQSTTFRVTYANRLADARGYQWFFAGDPIENATSSTISLSNIAADHLGLYHVEVRHGRSHFDSVVTRSDVALLVDDADPIVKGGLKKELFLNLMGYPSIDSLTSSPRFPDRPDETGTVSAFELPDNFANSYGAHLSGFLVPPKTGEYVFYLLSNDTSQLFLSTDDSPSNKVRIATYTGRNGVYRGWQDLRPKNISKPIQLQAGKTYWVEALYREGFQIDHFAVAWRMAGEPPPKNGDPPIPGEFLQYRLE